MVRSSRKLKAPFCLGVFLLPVTPPARLAYPDYRARPVRAVVELLLAIVTVRMAFAIPDPEGAWSSPWTYAGVAAIVGPMIPCWARQSPSRHQGRSSVTGRSFRPGALVGLMRWAET